MDYLYMNIHVDITDNFADLFFSEKIMFFE